VGHPAPGHVESLAKLALLSTLLQWNLPRTRVCFLFLRFLVDVRFDLVFALWSFKHVFLYLADTLNNRFEKALGTHKIVPVLVH